MNKMGIFVREQAEKVRKGGETMRVKVRSV